MPCIFCGHVEKKICNRRVYVSFPKSEQTNEEIKTIAMLNDDARIVQIIERKETVAYHGVCLTSYQVKTRRSVDQHEAGFWHEDRAWHKNAFNSLSAFITQEIIEKRGVLYMKDLFLRYKALLLEFMKDNRSVKDVNNYRLENLETKIMNAFGDSITVETFSEPQRKKIVYLRDIDTQDLVSKIAYLQTKDDNKLEHAAYELRNYVKNIKAKKLPEKLTADDVIEGECEIPNKLFDFMCNLIQGPDIRRKNSDEDFIKIKSLCSDIIYITTKGRVKPSKHLKLALAMKSLTSSRKVISILNKYGHTIGYNLTEEIETEMTHTAHEDSKMIPSGIDPVSERSTHVAFDNFDRFVDTSSGKDTLHDTVGIIYQFTADRKRDESENMEMETEEVNLFSTTDIVGSTGDCTSRPRKRRRFEGVLHNIQPYYKQPVQGMSLLPVTSIKDAIHECKYMKDIAVDKDLIWLILLSRFKSTPMWLAFNCKFSSDDSKIQTIEYLPSINASPTSDTVVHKTLEIASEIAKDCKQDNIIVTYDLAIAKIAMQIQEALKPKFDNIFVNMGAFHI
ncbi:unnamed protein product [Euphydryas editha]|nr:unnamed protein product [Euphydryas editha]